MTLTRKEQKNLNCLIRKASEKDLKRLNSLIKSRLISLYFKDFNRVSKDVEKTLKMYQKTFIEHCYVGVPVGILRKRCEDGFKIPSTYFNKVVDRFKRSGHIYEPEKGFLCWVDSETIKRFKKTLKQIELVKK